MNACWVTACQIDVYIYSHVQPSSLVQENNVNVHTYKLCKTLCDVVLPVMQRKYPTCEAMQVSIACKRTKKQQGNILVWQ